LLGLAAAGALGAVGVLLVGFVWPSVSSEVELGPVEAFPVGSVTSLYRGAEDESFRRLLDGEIIGTGWVRTGEIIHLVRQEDGSFVAFDGVAARLEEEQVVWRPDFWWEGSQGWFRTPGSSSTFALDGRRVFGPTPRDLDRYEVRVEDGLVIVDTRDVTLGSDEIRPPYVQPFD
ncbi:MAG: hypothetical protein M0R75_15345, partial [Dehalococcoidia bacterium]|nr:hypothetical protein [Dehalococcoidia bacterium]